MSVDETNFPIDVKSPFVNLLQKVIVWSIKALAFLMVLVILWSLFDVVIALFVKSKETPWKMVEVDQLLGTFGAFLVVLIAIEIFLNIILYLRKDIGHLKLVIATAIMAVARKVIILEYDRINEMHMVGMASLILALGICYWFVSLAHQAVPAVPSIHTASEPQSTSNSSQMHG